MERNFVWICFKCIDVIYECFDIIYMKKEDIEGEKLIKYW